MIFGAAISDPLKTHYSEQLGAWLSYRPEPTSEMLGTGYLQFEAACGVKGLAKENAERLDVLAVISIRPGTGQFREFIRKVQTAFTTVCIWEDWTPGLGEALERYGFHRTEQVQPWGESNIGWRWDAASLKKP